MGTLVKRLNRFINSVFEFFFPPIRISKKFFGPSKEELDRLAEEIDKKFKASRRYKRDK